MLYALRLQPGDDLRQSLQTFARQHHLQAACIVSGIGSLEQAVLRFAGKESGIQLEQKFEILSLNGTLSLHGIHLHMMIADSTGQVIGGHVCDGCLIRTTAELVMATLPDQVFLRTPDSQTGYLELEIRTEAQ